MSQSEARHSGYRRPRTERGKRSKNGCQTCISKKVKCDEKQPICTRCNRLGLQCEWIRKAPLAQRRRGHGPIKDRHSWTPRAIQPKDEDSVCSDEVSTDLHSPQIEVPAYNISDDLVNQSTNGIEFNLDQAIDSQLSPQSINNIIDIPLQLPPTLSILPWTDTFISNKDMQALSFHRTVYAPLKSTRDSSHSSHSVFLHRAFNRQMALHFLLAVSHNELSIHRGCGYNPPPESRIHFRRGFDLFLQIMHGNGNGPMDHLNIILSFLFMYLFWMRRDRFNPRKLHQLSKNAYRYIRRFRLEYVCANHELFPFDQTFESSSDQIILARALVYLYDRDGFCCFFGCGGLLANYINQFPTTRQHIWRLSRAPCLWPILGLDDINDDTEELRVLDLYFDLIVIHQEINCLSQCILSDTRERGLELRRRLGELERNNPTIHTLHHNPTQPTSLMACVTVTFFHAIRIYLHRSTNPFGSTPIHPEIETALTGLVSAAYKTVSTGAVQLLERFQWSLLIAGIETSDPVHRDWIVGSISDAGIQTALQLILAEKGRLGGCISIQVIRDLIRRNCGQ